MYWPQLLVSAVIATFVQFGGVHCGILDLFNSKSVQGLTEVMNTVFNVVENEARLLMTGHDDMPIQEAITFWCRNRDSDKNQQVLLNDSDVSKKIDLKKPVWFVIHGWLSSANTTWVQQTVEDITKFNDVNACAVDWSHLAAFEYAEAAINHTMMVSGYLTKFVQFLNNSGVPLENVTLAGHSLGAQIAGQTGYNLEGQQIGQIYGMDPAGPLFTNPKDRGLQYRLDRTDAKYVQFIDTSRELAGVGSGDGHENFYPNGGFVPQTNCIIPITKDAEFGDLIVCSHSHATSLFRLSLDPAIPYEAKKCRDWTAYNLGLCLLESSNLLGVHSNRMGGNFYLRTSVFSPYNSPWL